MTPMRKRLRYALVCYALIGVSACFTLEGRLRWIVLILMAVLGVRSWVATRRDELE